MRARFAPVFALLVVIGCMESACGGLVDPSKNQLETLTGTLTAGNVAIFGPYNVTKSGEYTVTLVSFTPSPLLISAPAGVVTFGIGSSTSCQSVQPVAQVNAVAGRQALGSSITPGTYCIAIGDAGFLTTGVVYNFTMQFSHP